MRSRRTPFSLKWTVCAGGAGPLASSGSTANNLGRRGQRVHFEALDAWEHRHG